MLTLDARTLTPEEILAIVPGSRLVDLDESILTAAPEDLYPNPHGDHPPSDWFVQLPAGFGPDDQPYIDEQGRVAAVAWPYDRCHIGYTADGSCLTLPPSPTDNHMFHQGSTVTADGTQLPTGFLGLHGHDQNPASTLTEAMEFYNDPTNAVARGRILETPEAAYFVGAVKSGATHGQVETLRGGCLSGDWRWIPELGEYDALGPCVVARPGLPTSYRAAAAGGPVVFELNWRVKSTAGGRIVSTPAWDYLDLETLDMQRRKKMHIATGRKVQALAGGFVSYQQQRDALSQAIDALIGADMYGWVVDFDDSTVVYEDGDYEKMMVDYTVAGTVVSFVGTPVPIRIQYVQADGKVQADGGCGCKVQAAGDEPSVDGQKVADLEDQVAEQDKLINELQERFAQLEAANTDVPGIVEAPVLV